MRTRERVDWWMSRPIYMYAASMVIPIGLLANCLHYDVTYCNLQSSLFLLSLLTITGVMGQHCTGKHGNTSGTSASRLSMSVGEGFASLGQRAFA